MPGADYTKFGPPPLATPITEEGDELGIPFQNRGLPSGDLKTSWAQWFNALWNLVTALNTGPSGTIHLAKLTTGGANGTITVINGKISAFVDPT